MKFALIICLSCLPVAPLSAESADDQRDISAVIEAFRTGIINKDRAALEKLPVNPDISFMSSATPETLAFVRARRPDYKRLSLDTYPGFVEYISTSKEKLEETFDNISIQSDGTVASVFFAYTFKENGKISNSGTEIWGMIATDEGWKISSVIWSVSVPEAQKSIEQ